MNAPIKIKFQYIRILAIGLAFGTTSCVSTSTPRVETINAQPQGCAPEVAQTLEQLVGRWRLDIRADEGWTGYGESIIEWDTSLKCGIIEKQNALFNKESETPLITDSVSILVFDALSETLKVFTSDSRGYTHLGLSGGRISEGFVFEIAQATNRPATRRIKYQNMQADSFEWAWQGRANEGADWGDRLFVRYNRF